ncbi:FHA domain-containing protein [bacterium]|nr:FHA domain-containing protein [bacterium]
MTAETAPVNAPTRWALARTEGAGKKDARVLAFPCVLGRLAPSTVLVDEPGVSPEHCMLIEDAGAVFVVDLNSSSGTFVDGTRVRARARIEAGSKLALGSTTFRLELARAAVGATPPAARPRARVVVEVAPARPAKRVRVALAPSSREKVRALVATLALLGFFLALALVALRRADAGGEDAPPRAAREVGDR